MRALSWVEFLLTFGIFLVFVLFIFNRYFEILNIAFGDLNRFFSLQRLTTLAVLLLNNNISSLGSNFISSYLEKNYEPFVFYIKARPQFIFLKKYPPVVELNSITFFYNSTSGSYEFKQTVSYEITSKLAVLVYSTKRIEIYNYSASYICIPYLNVNLPVAFISAVRNYTYCEITLVGNSSIQFKNIEGFVMLDKYISNLPLYVGTKYSYKKIGNDFFSIFMLSTFLYKSNKDWIEEIYLKVG